MKKVLSLALCVFVLLGCMSVSVFAEEDSATVYVSVADKGELVAAQVEVNVVDIDSDGKLTVNDALYALHEAVYEGGSQAGYGYYIHKDYGLSLGKLWGDTSGNFGYYINNSSCWGLADVVKNGDYVNAFIYSDTKFYSDTYCFFNVNTVTADRGDEIVLILNGAGYDANWNPITVPVVGAEITVDGEGTGIVTDENGQAVITIDKAGRYVISAVSSTGIIVPPVCSCEVNGIFKIIYNAIVGFLDDIYNFLVSLFA